MSTSGIQGRLLTGRMEELDAIRGLAALAVVACHLPIGFWFGETGVDLFFVLSGYLITGIVLRTRDRPGFLRVFFFRRALRIWPIYYVALAAVLVFQALRHTPPPLDAWPWYALYLQHVWEYFVRTVPELPNFGHTWTLAIEEQFYLFWPVALFAFRSRLAFRIIVAVGLLLPFAMRADGFSPHLLLTHSDTLVLGAALAAYETTRRDWSDRGHRRLFTAILVAGAIGYAVLTWYVLTHGGRGKDVIESSAGVGFISLAYFGVVGLVRGLAGTPTLGWLRHGSLVYLGQISYGLYLYHWIVFEWADHVFKFGRGVHDGWLFGAAKVLVSLLVAVASWEWFEKPILRLKDRIEYGAPATPAAG